jgi:hypothetical protein
VWLSTKHCSSEQRLPFSPPRTTSTAVDVRMRARVSGELSRYSITLSTADASRMAFRSSDGISLA